MSLPPPPPASETETSALPPPCAVDTLNGYINFFSQIRDAIIGIEAGENNGWLDKAQTKSLRDAMQTQVRDRARQMIDWEGQA